MKRVWAIRRDEEAVSPVIATILMVAVTVVLVAVLYVMVLGFGGGGVQTPIATFDKAAVTNGKTITVLSISKSDLPWDEFTIQLSDGQNFSTWTPAKADMSSTGGHNYSTQTLGSLTVCCVMYDLLGNGYVNGGDYLTLFTYGGAPTFSGTTEYSATFIYEPSAERIGTAVTFLG